MVTKTCSASGAPSSEHLQ